LVIPAGIVAATGVPSFKRPLRAFLVLCAAFVFLCGLGHGQEAWFGFRGKCGRYNTIFLWWNALTALVSAVTAWVVLTYFRVYIEEMKRALTVAELTVLLREATTKLRI